MHLNGSGKIKEIQSLQLSTLKYYYPRFILRQNTQFQIFEEYWKGIVMGGHNFQILPKLTCWRLHGYRIHWHMKWFLYLHRWRWWNLGGVFKIHVISVQTQRKILIPASQKYHISGSLNKGKNMYETQFEIKLTETNIRQKEVIHTQWKFIHLNQ